MCLVGHFLCPSIPTTAPPLCPSFSSFASFPPPSPVPASSLSPLFSFLLPSPILCSTFSTWPGIVQLKCRNCPLEFILKFVAFHLLAVSRDLLASRSIPRYSPYPLSLPYRYDKYNNVSPLQIFDDKIRVF